MRCLPCASQVAHARFASPRTPARPVIVSRSPTGYGRTFGAHDCRVRSVPGRPYEIEELDMPSAAAGRGGVAGASTATSGPPRWIWRWPQSSGRLRSRLAPGRSAWTTPARRVHSECITGTWCATHLQYSVFLMTPSEPTRLVTGTAATAPNTNQPYRDLVLAGLDDLSSGPRRSKKWPPDSDADQSTG